MHCLFAAMLSVLGMLQKPLLLLPAARTPQADVYKAARSLYGGRASSGFSSAASGAMGTVGAVWSFVSAEAATEGSLAPEDAAPLPPPPKLDISVSVSVLAEGESPHCRSSLEPGTDRRAPAGPMQLTDAPVLKHIGRI